MSIRFDMDNMMIVQCFQRKGMAISSNLQNLSDDIFSQAPQRGLLITAKFVPDQENDWTDVLCRFWGTFMEWQRCPQVFEALSLLHCLGLPIHVSVHSSAAPLLVTQPVDYGRGPKLLYGPLVLLGMHLSVPSPSDSSPSEGEDSPLSGEGARPTGLGFDLFLQ